MNLFFLTILITKKSFYIYKLHPYKEILIIYTYATKEQTSARVQNYYFLAQMIKKSSEYEKGGLNIKISDEIINYLKNNYPDLLSEESANRY